MLVGAIGFPPLTNMAAIDRIAEGVAIGVPLPIVCSSQLIWLENAHFSLSGSAEPLLTNYKIWVPIIIL